MQTKGQQTHDKILKISRDIFIKKGFQNTSISEILDATGVKKGNLYYHFKSKDALGLAVLNDAKKEFTQLLSNSFIGKTPLAKIKSSIRAVSKMMRKTNFVGGCLFGNTALEMSDINPEFSDVIKEVFFYWSGLIEEQLVEAQSVRLIDKTIEAKHLAKLVLASVEGGIMLSRVSKDKNDFEDCMNGLDHLLSK